MKKKLRFLLPLLLAAFGGWQNSFAQTDAEYDAALGALGDGGKFALYTLSNGTSVGEVKYFLKSDGYLTDKITEAKLFAFVQAAGDFKPTGYKVGMFTNGGDAGNNFSGLSLNRIGTNSSNRDTWEAQVFFLNASDDYAVRSTNAVSGSWGASAFWTVVPDNDGDGLPNATYTVNSVDYVWKVMDETTFNAAYQAAYDAEVAALVSGASLSTPSDMSSYWISNPSPYSTLDGWTLVPGTQLYSWASQYTTDGGNRNAEVWGWTSSTLKQTLANLPAGLYELTAQAFTRTGIVATLYANDNKVSLVQMPNSGGTAGVDYLNSRGDAKTYFDAGKGYNKIRFVVDSPEDVEIGINTGDSGDGWTVWRGFQLLYMGPVNEEVLYNLEFDEAQAIFNDPAYANVGGTEKANLQAIMDAGFTAGLTEAEYIDLRADLAEALADFTAAKAAYDGAQAITSATGLIFNTNEACAGWASTDPDKKPEDLKLNTWSTEFKNAGAFVESGFLQSWRSSGSGNLADITLQHETLKGLTNGKYILTITAGAISEVGNAAGDGATLFANGATVAMNTGVRFNGLSGIADDYEMFVDVTDGTLTFGVDINRSNFNFLGIESAQLEYLGATLADAVTTLEGKMPTGVMADDVYDAMVEADYAAAGNPSEDNFVAFSDAVAAANYSANLYASLQNYISDAQALYDAQNEQTNSTRSLLMQSIDKGKEVYKNHPDNASAEAAIGFIKDAYKNSTESIALYNTLTSAINNAHVDFLDVDDPIANKNVVAALAEAVEAAEALLESNEDFDVEAVSEVVTTALDNAYTSKAGFAKAINDYNNYPAADDPAVLAYAANCPASVLNDYKNALKNTKKGYDERTLTDYNAIERSYHSLIAKQNVIGAELIDLVSNYPVKDGENLEGWVPTDYTTVGNWQYISGGGAYSYAGIDLGTKVPETWVWNGNNGAIGNNEISQTIDGLLAGKYYELTMFVKADRQNGGIPTGLTVFANDNVTPLSAGIQTGNVYYDEYKVQAAADANGSLKIGLLLSGANFNWLVWKATSLKYIEVADPTMGLPTFSVANNENVSLGRAGDGVRVTFNNPVGIDQLSSVNNLYYDVQASLLEDGTVVCADFTYGNGYTTGKLNSVALFGGYDYQVGKTYEVKISKVTLYDGGTLKSYVDNKGYSVKFNVVLLTEGDYVFENVATGMYLIGANSWGTQASLGPDHGLPFTVTISNGKYKLDSHVANSSTQHYLGDILYIDSDSNPEWTIETIGSGIYTISNGNGYISSQDGSTVLVQTAAASGKSYWRIKSKEQILDDAIAYGDIDNPVDITSLIKDANFDRNSYRSDFGFTYPWNGDPKKDGLTENFNGEKWSGSPFTFDVNQTLTGLPQGNYLLRAQGYFRQGDGNNAANLHQSGDENITAEFYAVGKSTSTRTMPSIFDDNDDYPEANNNITTVCGTIPDRQWGASAGFSEGRYEVSLQVTVGTGGELTIGVRSTAECPGVSWAVFDNFRLYYLGSSNTTVNSIGTETFYYVERDVDYDNDEVPYAAIFGDGAVLMGPKGTGMGQKELYDGIILEINSNVQNQWNAHFVGDITVDEYADQAGTQLLRTYQLKAESGSKIEGGGRPEESFGTWWPAYVDEDWGFQFFKGMFEPERMYTFTINDLKYIDFGRFCDEDPALIAAGYDGCDPMPLWTSTITPFTFSVVTDKTVVFGPSQIAKKQVKSVTEYEIDDITDGISGINAENGNQTIYNIAGQRVSKAQKGLYIVNGKKVLVK